MSKFMKRSMGAIDEAARVSFRNGLIIGITTGVGFGFIITLVTFILTGVIEITE